MSQTPEQQAQVEQWTESFLATDLGTRWNNCEKVDALDAHLAGREVQQREDAAEIDGFKVRERQTTETLMEVERSKIGYIATIAQLRARIAELESAAKVGEPCAWLEIKLQAMPRRQEVIGGQWTDYLQRDEVLQWVKQAKTLAPPAQQPTAQVPDEMEIWLNAMNICAELADGDCTADDCAVALKKQADACRAAAPKPSPDVVGDSQ